MRLRPRRDTNESSLEVVAVNSGLIVQGSPSEVSEFVDRAKEIVKKSGGRSRHLVADGAAALSSLNAHATTHREYVEFSPRSEKLLREHGVIPTGDGWFRSLVRSDTQIVGNLDWRPVDLAPEQALAFQTAAVHLAMRAAIRDVVAAIERVEGKVDNLVALTRAERLGNVVGDRLTLEALAATARERGGVSATDWSTVDSLGAQIARDIGTLRAYTLQEIADTGNVRRRRSSELKELTDDLLVESLALLVVAEQNYLLWQEVRIAHVAANEPAEATHAIADARSQLQALTNADQNLVDELLAAAQGLLRPSGFEGFVPLERSRLKKRGVELNNLVGWFANQRQLDADDLQPEFPSLRESASEATVALGAGARAASSAVGSGVSRLRRRPEVSGQPDDE
jgi:pyruvate/2-oxoglutarate dehydrogenase complex dihydrolipoamide acyltransferase (E2) component